MKHIKNYLHLFVLLFASEIIFSDEIEEVIVTADYRNTELNKEDSSIFVLDTEEIKGSTNKAFRKSFISSPKFEFCCE
jgi:hypothetical protein